MRTRTPGKVSFPLRRPPGLQLSCAELTGKGPVCRRNCLLASTLPPSPAALDQKYSSRSISRNGPCAPHPGREVNRLILQSSAGAAQPCSIAFAEREAWCPSISHFPSWALPHLGRHCVLSPRWKSEPLLGLSSQAISNSELCSAPCWCLVKLCSLQSLEGHGSRRVRVRTLCTGHKRILYSNFLSETGHPASFVCFLETSSRNPKIHHLCWIPLGVCGRCFGTS